MISVDTLREIKKETGADKVRLEVGDFDDGFEVEVRVFKGDKVFRFSTDYSGDGYPEPSFAKYVIDHVRDKEQRERNGA